MGFSWEVGTVVLRVDQGQGGQRGSGRPRTSGSERPPAWVDTKTSGRAVIPDRQMNRDQPGDPGRRGADERFILRFCCCLWGAG